MSPGGSPRDGHCSFIQVAVDRMNGTGRALRGSQPTGALDLPMQGSHRYAAKQEPAGTHDNSSWCHSAKRLLVNDNWCLCKRTVPRVPGKERENSRHWHNWYFKSLPLIVLKSLGTKKSQIFSQLQWGQGQNHCYQQNFQLCSPFACPFSRGVPPPASWIAGTTF